MGNNIVDNTPSLAQDLELSILGDNVWENNIVDNTTSLAQNLELSIGETMFEEITSLRVRLA